MKEFLGPEFQLETPTAIKLYENYAKNQPIYDYHCHLFPKDIYEDRRFTDITEVWLVDGQYGDHYKWRAMRARGVEEKYITGNASYKEKFVKWAETVPFTIGNPLYLWTHMELRKYFGINKILSKDTAEEIYQECNLKLQTLTTRKMIEASNVKVICTTDDPCDDLKWHILLKQDQSFKTAVLPAFRPDKALNIDDEVFIEWIKKLAIASNMEIVDFIDLQQALVSRIDFFHEVGCRISDHALDEVSYQETSIEEVSAIFKKRMTNSNNLTWEEIKKYKGFMLIFFGQEYAKRGWTQQYHINARRNLSTKSQKMIGVDSGFDGINDSMIVTKLVNILDQLEMLNGLPKTIFYSLNSKDNETLATICNCFNEKNIKGKMQLGSAWWFHDQKAGMMQQMTTLANMGLISNFVGMVTDSRSFLSYPRHDYFRRLLCNLFGNLIETGEYPNDLEFVGEIIKDICYNNAKNYFRLEL